MSFRIFSFTIAALLFSVAALAPRSISAQVASTQDASAQIVSAPTAAAQTISAQNASAQVASAQFEGEVRFHAFEPDEPNSPTRTVQFFATPDRILLQSNFRYRAFPGLDADAFMVRNDRQDFVFLSGSEQAMQISKDEVQGLANLIGRMQGGNQGQSRSFDWDTRLEETGQTQQILGFRTEQFKVHEENSDRYVSVWLTDEIQIRWGMLQDTWDQTLSSVIEIDMPIEVFMNRRSFPLQIDYYDGDRLITRVEARQVDRRAVNPERFDIPEGARMIGIADLMMNMMRQRR